MSKIERAQTERLSRGAGGKMERRQKPPSGTKWPDFSSVFNPMDDPLDGLTPSDDLEGNANDIMNAVAEVFIEDEHKKLDDYRTMLDPAFYTVVCFQSQEQRDDFLAKAGWDDLGSTYIDGLQVARRLGLDVPPIPLATKGPKKIPRPLRDVKIIKKGGDN